MQEFHFKQFSLQHSKSAHKVGTDGVLLGAWTNLKSKPNTILDIGTGTGLIALIMAQRSNAETIDAVELSSEGFEECVENFENSIWNGRLFCYHGDIKHLAVEEDLNYDLIISNPPFFENTDSHKSSNRDKARKQISLTYEDLLKCVKKLLNQHGEFSTIIPYQDYNFFNKMAEKLDLFPYKITHVKGRSDSAFKRSLMQFSFEKRPVVVDELILELSRHNYTREYKNLVKDFYLKL